MSYDLYFTSPSISLDEFESYFSKNPLYELNNGQAFYQNDATGVYFFFSHGAEDEDDFDFNVEASFNLNFYRPHFFSLEAVAEVEQFVSHFNCEIVDPQNDGMDNSLFSLDGFLKGWNAGNHYAVKSIYSKPDSPNNISLMPTKRLEKIWQWNYSIAEKNSIFGERLFVPRIIFMKVNGMIGTCAVWPDAIPTFLPSVDFLYVPRKNNAPKKLLKKRTEDNCLIYKRDFPKFFLDYIVEDSGIEAFKLPNPETPGFIKRYISGLTAFDGQIEGIAIDSVLNQELVETN